MAHGCFISYKKEDKNRVEELAKKLDQLSIPFNYLDKTIKSDNIDTVISVLREQYMNNKPVTLFLIGKHSYEDTKERWKKETLNLIEHPEYNEQSFIIRELRATLSDYDGNPRHGIVGIVLPDMYEKIYRGTTTCPYCHEECRVVSIDDDTVIREFSNNYYLIPDNENCSHYSEDGRYCILCRFDEFLEDPEQFIDKAYDKSKSKIADSAHYKDIKHDYKLRDE